MAAAEGAASIIQVGDISVRRHLVVDLHGGAERDLPHGPSWRRRGSPPPPLAAFARGWGPQSGAAPVDVRSATIALAEGDGVARAAVDVPHANVAVNPEEAVSSQVARIRCRARRTRPFAGVAAITTMPI